VEAEEEAAFQPVVRNVVLKKPIDDPAKEAFKSSYVAARTVIGFVLFFPNFSTFLAQGGYYIEDLYVRKPFRGGGFGTILLKSVVQQAKKLGAGRVEWCVLDWNVNAIKFYEGLGAVVMPEWRICRLTGDALQSCAL
jgi:GNAT superfamily N-acetyltransferase